MSPRSASPTVPRRDRGAEPSADGEWPRVCRPSCPLSRQPAGGGCPRRCVLNYLECWLRGSPPPALPRAPCRGRAPGWRGGWPRSALCSSGGWESRVAAGAGAGGGGREWLTRRLHSCTGPNSRAPLPAPRPPPPANPSFRGPNIISRVLPEKL